MVRVTLSVNHDAVDSSCGDVTLDLTDPLLEKLRGVFADVELVERGEQSFIVMVSMDVENIEQYHVDD